MAVIKPLVWSEPKPPDKDVPYNHVIAETPFGRIVIDWKSWKDDGPYDGYRDEREISESPWGWMAGADDLEVAKQKAQDEFAKRVNECLMSEQPAWNPPGDRIIVG